jgi:hypothetical protein
LTAHQNALALGNPATQLKLVKRGGVDLGLLSREVAHGASAAGINSNRWFVGMGVDLVPQVASEGNALTSLHSARVYLPQAVLMGLLANDLEVKAAAT